MELDFCLVSHQRAGRVMMPAAVASGRPFLLVVKTVDEPGAPPVVPVNPNSRSVRTVRPPVSRGASTTPRLVGSRMWPLGCAMRLSQSRSSLVLTKVEKAVTVGPVGEFELKGIRRPLAAYNVVASVTTHSDSSDSAD